MDRSIWKEPFCKRFARHEEELRELFLGLYHDEAAWDDAVEMLYRCWEERPAALRRVGVVAGAAAGGRRSGGAFCRSSPERPCSSIPPGSPSSAPAGRCSPFGSPRRVWRYPRLSARRGGCL